MKKGARHPEMSYRTVGNTGGEVSAIGLTWWHLELKEVDEPLSFRIVRSAIVSLIQNRGTKVGCGQLIFGGITNE